MATRSLNVVISGDVSKLKGAFRRGGDEAEKFSKKTREASDRTAEGFKKIHEASKLLLEIGGLSTLAFGLKDVTEEAVKAEAEQKKLANTVKDAGLSWKAHSKEIDEWLDKTSLASGFVKSDLTAAFGNFIRTTGSVTKAQKLEGEAMDVARSKGISLAGAQSLLARVYNGSYVGLKRLGIAITPITKAQDQLKETTKHATVEQVRHAKALDQSATRTSALGIIQDKFGGQSRAFASSTAGSFERARASLNLFEEQVGKVVLPLMAKAAIAIVKVATIVGEKWPAIEHTIAGVVAKVKKAITDWVNKNRADINSVISAAVKFGQAVKTVFEAVVLPIIKRTVPAIGKILGDLVDVIRGVVRLISGLLSGNWSKAWSGAKEAVGGAARAILTLVTTLAGDLWTIIKALGPKLIKALLKGLENLGKALATGIFEGVKAAAKAVPGLVGGALKGIGKTILNGITGGLGGGITGAIGKLVGDGVGRARATGALPSGGAFGGSLMGAQPALRPFAAIGSRFGLRVSSGRRPGAITTSGNVSYHSSGEAIDEAGTPAGMMGYFRYLKSHFGGRLAELIYGPGQVGIKNGQPFNFGPALNAQHMDHVHVAFDTGRPGVGDGPGRQPGRYAGDGLGKFVATSYGPPWGGIQGGGVTATGVNLRGSPHEYGVAVDPSVIPLGSKLKITPNPFGYGGAFTAFDTGGAIKGHRLDFYDWRGRRAQLGWGSRSVSVETYSAGRGRGRGSSGSSKPAAPRTGRGGSSISLPHPTTGSSPFPHILNPQNPADVFYARQHGIPIAPTKGVARDLNSSGDSGSGGGAGGDDPNQPLIDAINAEAEAAKNLADQMAGVQSELKANRDFATSLSNTSNYQLTKMLTDIISRQVGVGVVGRSYTPGTGVEVAY